MPHESAIEIQYDGEWFVGWSLEVPGANGKGHTLEECRADLNEAIILMLEERDVDTFSER